MRRRNREYRLRACARVLAGILVAWHPAQSASAGPQQDAADAPQTASDVPRTADGRPDLGGVWSFATAAPLERPDQFGDKAVLTEEEAAAYVASLPTDGCRIINCDGSVSADVETAYGIQWWDWGDTLSQNRTSLIVDPPNGRIPELAQAAQEARQQRFARFRGGQSLQSIQNRSLSDRCIVGSSDGPPYRPFAYNNHIQVFQTPDRVAILNEMIHSVRVVWLDRPGLPSNIRQWHGDPRGRWEGDTFVIETANFRPDSTSNGSAFPDQFQLEERFTRLDADTLLYQYTMDDPQTWTQPWTVQIALARMTDAVYEYACFEGNYSMENILRGARVQELEAAR